MSERNDTSFDADPYQNDDICRLRSQILINRHDHIAKMLGIGASSFIDMLDIPSPPPVYDPDTGQRTNTREHLIQSGLDLERRVCMDEAFKINPHIQIPANYRPTNKEINIFIPHKDHPSYNFIGLLLGPRGCTQKRLEQETDTKITICGKENVKGSDHSVGRSGSAECNADSYIHIVGDSWDKVDAAIELVEPLLTYIQEEENIHKRNQMLQIAKNNGSWQLNQFENDKAGELMLIKQMSGPLGSDRKGVFQLPDHLKGRMELQYRRDIEKAKGVEPVNIDEQFRQFMCELDTKYMSSGSTRSDNWETTKREVSNYEFNNKRRLEHKNGFCLNQMKSITDGAPPYGGFSPCF